MHTVIGGGGVSETPGRLFWGLRIAKSMVT